MYGVFKPIVVVALLAPCLASSAHAAIRAELIDFQGYQAASIYAMSGDGQSVFARLNNAAPPVVQWSAQSAELVPIAWFNDYATSFCSSFTGNSFAYTVSTNNTSTAYRFFNSGVTAIGPSTAIRVCSDDGNTLAGTNNGQGWLWTKNSGYRAFTSFDVYGGSSNGQFLVGRAGTLPAVRTELGGATAIPRPSNNTSSWAGLRISTNGAVVSGNADNRACRWVNLVPELLPLVPGLPNGAMSVSDMSDDGSIIVGRVTSGATFATWLWTPALGTVNLRSYLQSQGVPVGGLVPTEIHSLSNDGLSICGLSGVASPFYVHFDSLPVPSPSGSVVILFGVFVSARRRR